MKRLGPEDIKGQIIDSHTHVGISVSAFLAGGYPYCQSVESLLFRMDAEGVDRSVTFPLCDSLYFDVSQFLKEKRRVPLQPALMPAPYVVENRVMCQEVYEKVPSAPGRILPFPAVDPVRQVGRQIEELTKLAAEYPIYGLKAIGIMIQSSHMLFKGSGRAFIDFTREHNLPFILHSMAYAGDHYSHNSINLEVARAFPEVRFSLAHCLGFDREHLDEANALANVWVDCAAMKIQIEPDELVAPPERRFPSDYSSYRKVFCDLVKAYPNTMLWGSDAPAYSYIENRPYPDGTYVNFTLQGTYASERAALAALTPEKQRRVSNENTVRYLFG